MRLPKCGKQVLTLLTVCLMPGWAFAGVAAETLYKYEGKTYQAEQLSPAAQQAVYDAAKLYYDNLVRIIESEVQQQYLENTAKKTGKNKAQLEAELANVAVSEKEAKAWYEENKSRLGERPFEGIRADIIQFLKSQKQEGAKVELLAKLKQQGAFSLLLSEPQAPQLTINSEGYPVFGAAKAKVTIVEFADYLCPHCKEAAKVLKRVIEKHKDKVKLVFMDFPLRPVGLSPQIALGGVCADAQKKYWPYHHRAFEKTFAPTDNAAELLATELKLDMTAFRACMQDPASKAKVERSRAEGERLGIQGTPAIYINGKKIEGYEEALILKTLAKQL